MVKKVDKNSYLPTLFDRRDKLIVAKNYLRQILGRWSFKGFYLLRCKEIIFYSSDYENPDIIINLKYDLQRLKFRQQKMPTRIFERKEIVEMEWNLVNFNLKAFRQSGKILRTRKLKEVNNFDEYVGYLKELIGGLESMTDPPEIYRPGYLEIKVRDEFKSQSTSKDEKSIFDDLVIVEIKVLKVFLNKFLKSSF